MRLKLFLSKSFLWTAMLLVVFIFAKCNFSPNSNLGTLEKKVAKYEKERVLKLVENYWNDEAVSITANSSKRSAGGLNDFYSEGDYWWPDPENPDSAFIRKDGMSNPDNFVEHRHAMIRLNRIVGAMASAYLVTGEDKYVENALRHLKAWFINPATKMNPNLLYAQAIKGRYTGRGIGIIDALHLIEVARAIKVMEGSPAISSVEMSGLKNWFAEFLEWISTHEYGKSEMVHPNNHGTCWALQAAVYADLTDNSEMLDFCVDRFKNSILPLQMAADGSLPLELERTKPYGYSLFSLDAMSTLAQVLTTSGYDLWDFKTPDGKSMELGMDFLFPYIEGKDNWPYEEDVLYFDEYPVRQAFMFFGGLAYNKTEYIDNWLALESDPDHNEVMRNMIVKYPLLWLDLSNCDLPQIQNKPPLVLHDPDNLMRSRYLASKGIEPYSSDVDSLINESEELLNVEAFSVMNKEKMSPSGDKHDFYSLGIYWWPDPDKVDGLPYIRKDGYKNPERYDYDGNIINDMTKAVFTLSMGYFYSGKEDFALKAGELLKTWFLDPDTKMNPHLEYGQAIPGVCEGRGIGIIETETLIWVVEAIGLLDGSGALTDKETEGLRLWFEEYNNWLISSPKGWDERMWRNNHGSAYDAQVASFAIFTGNDSVAEMILDSVKLKRIEKHIMADGSQPHELDRTKGMGYSSFNLIHLCHNALMAERYDIDLWNYENSKGASILTAIKFLIPYISGEEEFPYQQIGGMESQHDRFWKLLSIVSQNYDDELIQETLKDFPSEHVKANYYRLLFPDVR